MTFSSRLIKKLFTVIRNIYLRREAIELENNIIGGQVSRTPVPFTDFSTIEEIEQHIKKQFGDVEKCICGVMWPPGNSLFRVVEPIEFRWGFHCMLLDSGLYLIGALMPEGFASHHLEILGENGIIRPCIGYDPTCNGGQQADWRAVVSV